MGRNIRIVPPSEVVPTTIIAHSQTYQHYSMNIADGVHVENGTLTPDTYPASAQVELNGKGILEFVGFYSGDATTRTITVKILLDGTQVIEKGNSIAGANRGMAVVGFWNGRGSAASPTGQQATHIPFNRQCQIFLKSNLADTGDCFIVYRARYV